MSDFDTQWNLWSSHCDQAAQEGWTISDCDGSENDTPWQLQALDHLNILANDDAAWLHVVTNARNGNELALTALEFLRIYSPKEYENIAKVHGALPIAL